MRETVLEPTHIQSLIPLSRMNSLPQVLGESTLCLTLTKHPEISS